MFDAKRLLDQFLATPPGGGMPTYQGRPTGGPAGDLLQTATQALGGFGGGALAGSLAGLLLGSKGGRKLAGSALTYGGLAVAGALAYRAYQNWQTGRQATADAPATLLPPPADTPFNPVGEAAQQSLSRLLLRAMIAAAKADGHIDATEQGNIFAQMDRLSLSAEDKAFVMDELRAPLDIDAVVGGVRGPEQAAEIYAVSLLAIDVDNPAERDYLARLAARLKLDPGLIAHLHATVEGATEPAPIGR